jgi:acetylglutamate kinase
MQGIIGKAAVLHEALPYIRRFHGRTFVVKYGGHAMADEELKESFARDICLLRYVGIRIVVVHGGGPQIDETLRQMGIESTFRGGLRVTDADTMRVVEMVLAGQVNSDIVGLICGQGGRAMGLSGRDDSFIEARPADRVAAHDPDGAPISVDLGRVGEIVRIDPKLIQDLCASNFVPVIAPIGIDPQGLPLNVNADTAAGEVAAALQAAKLVLMTDVSGVRDSQGNHLSSLGAAEVEHLINEGVIHGGMIPKVRCALAAVEKGVEKVHIIDGRQRHALLLEIFTDSGVGTEIHSDNPSPPPLGASPPAGASPRP